MPKFLESQLTVGQVKTITTGNTLDYVELLFSPTTRVEFAPSKDKTSIILSVSDNHLDIPALDCLIDKQTLRNYIVALQKIYNELIDRNESEA